MFQASVSFQVVRVPGVTNRYFGGDTHHFAMLTGPGTAWLQSMPMPQLAASLSPSWVARRTAVRRPRAGSSATCSS
jgi:uncharacterized protein (AIM24 family)